MPTLADCICRRHTFQCEADAAKDLDVFPVVCPACHESWFMAFVRGRLAAVVNSSGRSIDEAFDQVLLRVGPHVAALYCSDPAWRIGYATMWRRRVLWERAQLERHARWRRRLPNLVRTFLFQRQFSPEEQRQSLNIAGEIDWTMGGRRSPFAAWWIRTLARIA